MSSKWVFVLIFEFGEIEFTLELTQILYLRKVREGRGNGPQ